MPKFTRADIRRVLGEAHTEEIENQIMALHLGVVDAIKDELSKAKADAEKLADVQAELDKLKDGNNESYKSKYEKEHQEFEQYKSEQAAKDAKADKSTKYRALLKKAGVSDKRIDSVLKVSDIDAIKLDKDGNIEGSDKLIETIKSEWADFIVKEGAAGADTKTPPANNGSKLTKEEIYKTDDKGRFLMDATARQAALSQLIAAEQQKG